MNSLRRYIHKQKVYEIYFDIFSTIPRYKLKCRPKTILKVRLGQDNNDFTLNW